MHVFPSAYRSGDAIEETGIYRVSHDPHRLPAEVTLLRGESFPRCSRCGQPVLFYLVRAALSSEGRAGFRVTLNELPVLDDAEPLAS